MKWSLNWIELLILSFRLANADAGCKLISPYTGDEKISSWNAATCKNLDSTNLIELPDSNLEFLRITQSSISSLNFRIFSYFQYHLKKLYVTNSNVQEVIATPVAGLNTSLSVMDLSANNISIIHRNSFCGFRKLQFLSISRNNLANIDFVVNCSNFMAKTLDLSYNKISNISGQFTVVAWVENLNLTGNLISSLSTDYFLNLDQLASLNLGENQITHIPAGAFRNLRSLISLNLSKNKISFLTLEAFSGLNSLNAIDLSFNNISSISADVLYNLHNVRTFFINNNSISDTTIQDFIDYLPLLQRIALDENNWTCSELRKRMWSLREKRIVVEPGRNFGVRNFNGIICNDQNYADNQPFSQNGKIISFEELLKKVSAEYSKSNSVDSRKELINDQKYTDNQEKTTETLKPFPQNGPTVGYEELLKKVVAEYFKANGDDSRNVFIKDHKCGTTLGYEELLKSNGDDSRKNQSIGEHSRDFSILIVLVCILCVMFSIFLCKYIGCVSFSRVCKPQKVIQIPEDQLFNL